MGINLIFLVFMFDIGILLLGFQCFAFNDDYLHILFFTVPMYMIYSVEYYVVLVNFLVYSFYRDVCCFLNLSISLQFQKLKLIVMAYYT